MFLGTNSSLWFICNIYRVCDQTTTWTKNSLFQKMLPISRSSYWSWCIQASWSLVIDQEKSNSPFPSLQISLTVQPTSDWRWKQSEMSWQFCLKLMGSSQTVDGYFSFSNTCIVLTDETLRLILVFTWRSVCLFRSGNVKTIQTFNRGLGSI